MSTAADPVGLDERWDGVVVAPMRRRHLRGVLAIEERTNHRPWSMGLFLGELRMPTSRIYVVARRGHAVIGYAGLMINPDGGHVTNVAVDEGERRNGVATRMLLVVVREAVERGVEDLTLEVRMSNRGAQELYRRLGFAPGGVRPGYYSEVKEDALIMWAHGVSSPEGRARLDAVEASLAAPLVEETAGGR